MTIAEKQDQIITTLSSAHTDINTWVRNFVLVYAIDDISDAPFCALQMLEERSADANTYYAPGSPKIDEYRFALAIGDVVENYGTGEITDENLKSLRDFLVPKIESILTEQELILMSPIGYDFDYIGDGRKYAMIVSCIVHTRTR